MTNLSAITLLMSALLVSVASAQDKSQKPPCAGPEFRQLDFWVGDWDLTWTNPDGTKGKGTNVISRTLDGCVIEERFAATGGKRPLRGMSVSTYDVPAKGWRQTWVDNSGSYLPFSGGPSEEGFQFRLSKPDAARTMRMIWKNVTKESLDWHWQQSEDDGKTWKDKWVIHYKKAE